MSLNTQLQSICVAVPNAVCPVCGQKLTQWFSMLGNERQPCAVTCNNPTCIVIRETGRGATFEKAVADLKARAKKSSA